MKDAHAGRRKLPIYFLFLLFVLTGVFVAVLGVLTHRVKGDTFDSDGVNIHYTIEGEGEPVILLHGFAVNADLNFRLPGITQKLAEDFTVISMDLRGHGLSGKPHVTDAYGLEMVQDILRLMDHLKVDKAHIVGYSLGGFITLKLAATYPERVSTASALGSGWEQPDNSVFLAALPGLEGSLRSGKAIGPLMGQLGAEREKPTLLHTIWVKFMTGYLNDGEALASMVATIPELTLSEDELRSISVQVCSIVGERDAMLVGAQAMVGRVPDHTLVIIYNADHIGATARRETAQELKDFLLMHTR